MKRQNQNERKSRRQRRIEQRRRARRDRIAAAQVPAMVDALEPRLLLSADGGGSFALLPHDEPNAAAQVGGTIGDLVFNDFNGNGALDGGEPGVAGVDVNLYEDTNGNGTFDLGGGGGFVSDLSPGDIAIVAFNADNPDALAFVALTNIASGTEINFTDNGWLAGGGFRDAEGAFTWTAPADVTAGTVIQPTVNGPAFSTAGDQIFAYQGTATSPEFIYGVQFAAETWDSDATSSTTSALPAALTEGETAVAVGQGAEEIDNAYYAGPTAGDPATLRAAIGDTANWTASSTRVDEVNWPDAFNVSGLGGDTLVDTQTTDANGNYAFTSLAEGTYFVDVDENTLPEGFAVGPTVPAPEPFHAVVLAADGTDDTADFGYVGPANGAIGDLVYGDLDGDGAFEPGDGEGGLEGAIVRLFRDDGNGVFNTAPAGTPFFTESFELPEGDPSAIYDLTDREAFDDGFGDYFDRFEADSFGGRNIEYVFDAIDGDHFIGAQDINEFPDGPVDTGNVIIGGIDISGRTGLRLSGLFAAEDPAADGGSDYDPGDGIRVYASIDGGGEQLIGAFASEADGNTPLRLDTDLDGVGDGPALDRTFQDFTFELVDAGGNPLTGSTLDLRIELTSNAGDEDLALDFIRLFDDSVSFTGDEQIGSTITDETGAYLFEGLAPGDYFVEVDESTALFAERLLTGGSNPTPVAGLGLDEQRLDVDFGYELQPGTAEISGLVFLDSDDDGFRSFFSEFSTIAGVTVYLDLNENDAFDAGTEPSVTTESGSAFTGGAWEFTGLNAGAYTVRAELPGGVRLSNPLTSDGEFAVTRDVGQTIAGDDEDPLEFGVNFEPPVTEIVGTVFDDDDTDGSQDAGDDGLRRVAVELWADDGDGTFNPGSGLWINELHYDNAGADVNEGVEIAGPAGTNLSGWTLFGYDGNGGGTYDVLSLSGTIDNETNGFGAIWFNLTNAWGGTEGVSQVQNGPDGFALVDPDGRLVEFISYEGSFEGGNGPARGVTSADVGVAQTFGQQTTGETIQRVGSGARGVDFDWALVTADQGGSSRGDLNAEQTFTATGVAGDLLVRVTEADAAGQYAFGAELPAATYHVRVDPAAPPIVGGPSTTGGATQTLSIATGTSSAADFGFDVTATPGSIGGTVWNDFNEDQRLNAAENGFAGVPVTLVPDGGDGLLGASVGAELLNESFELPADDPASNYTLSNEFDDESFDFFGRFGTSGNAARDDFAGSLDGDWFIVGQDHDGEPFDPTQTVSFPAVTVGSSGALRFSAMFGALSSEPDFNNYEAEDMDGMEIYASVDGGVPTLIGAFAPSGEASDLFLDVDLDGVGDRTAARLTAQLDRFAFDMTGLTPGETVEFSVAMTSTGSFEPLAVDDVRISELAPSDDGTPIGAVTGPDGQYSFDDLDAGGYFVDVDQAAGDVAGLPLTTADDPRFVDLLNGQELDDVGFGFLGESTLSLAGEVFNDLENNGVNDAIDPGIENVPVSLYDDTTNPGAFDPSTVSSGTLTQVGGGLVISAVFDGPLTGGQPKGIELYALEAIPDLSVYGVGAANNGGGTDGVEFTFPADSLSAGDYIYLTDQELPFLQFFGVDPTYTDGGGAAGINGNDAIELFDLTDPQNPVVVDVFGDPNVDGVGAAWEYTDGWARRTATGGPNGGAFDPGNWDIRPFVLDAELRNEDAAQPVPVAEFGGGSGVTLGDRFLDRAVTDAEGRYEFTGVTPGDYIVDVENDAAALDGFASQAGSPDPAAVEKLEGQPLENADFGFISAVSLGIGDTVFNDVDGNGVFDPNTDLGLGGVELDLFLDRGTIGVLEPVSVLPGDLTGSGLLISAVFDGPLTGGQPKGVELYALEDIADLSSYGLNVVANGVGSDGTPDIPLSGSVDAGQYLYLTTDSAAFEQFFGFAPTLETDELTINGNDTIELYDGGVLSDVFGDANVDGAGTAWEYTDGWARRADGVSAPSPTFDPADWTFSGPDALDGATSNFLTAAGVPLASFGRSGTGSGVVGDPQVGAATSDADGTYLFSPVPPNDYLVQVDVDSAPTGATLTTASGSLVPITLPIGTSNLDVDFGFDLPFFGTGSIDGRVTDGSDNGLADVMLRLFADDGDGVLELGGPFISEIHYDNLGTDVMEGVEIAGPAGADLTGWSLALYNGNDGGVYQTIDLTGAIDDENGTSGARFFDVPGLQNGAPDGIALIRPDGVVVEFLSYEGSFLAIGGPADGFASSDIVVEQFGNDQTLTLQRTGSGDSPAELTWTAPTAASRGTLNAGLTVPTGGDTLLGSTPTAADGSYAFDNLADGDYLVDVTENAAPVAQRTLVTGSDPAAVNLAGGAAVSGVDFSFGDEVGTSAISGVVFLDGDGDGVIDAGETEGVGGATVWLDLDDDGVLDGDEPSIVTGGGSLAEGGGAFEFTGLLAGVYTIRVDLPAGFQATDPADGQTARQVSPGETEDDALFGALDVGEGVVGRRVFYNNSAFDGNDANANAADDAAIDHTVQALRPGDGQAGSQHYTSYTRGINGLVVDFAAGLIDPAQLSAADFAFRVGNAIDLSAFTDLGVVPTVDIRPGDGAGGSDRVTLVFPDGLITNQWLEVRVLPTAATGLTTEDLFYFGNLVGDTDGNALIDSNDVTAPFTQPHDGLSPAEVSDPADHDRDRFVNVREALTARSRLGNTLALISAPAATGAADASVETETADAAPVVQSVDSEPEGAAMGSSDGDGMADAIELALRSGRAAATAASGTFAGTGAPEPLFGLFDTEEESNFEDSLDSLLERLQY